LNRVFTNLSAWALWATGLAALARRIGGGRGRFTLEFHGVPRQRYPGQPRAARPRITGPDLGRILGWLSTRFPFLTPDEFLGSDHPGVLLTFDDGFANNHDVVLPLLERHEAPAVLFVATQHIGGGGRRLGFVEESACLAWGDIDSMPREAASDLFDGLGEDQLVACASHELITIGAHSVSHARLTAVDDAQLEDEIRRSKAVLEELTGAVVDLFAYPYGDADNRVACAVSEAGFRAAFVEGPLPIEFAAMAIPRVGLHGARPWYMAAKLSGLYDRPLMGKIFSA